MKIMIALAAAASVALSGCASVLKDIQGCERHYNGTVSGGTIQPAVLAGAALIDCCPVGYVATPDHKGCQPHDAPAPAAGATDPGPTPH